MPVQIIEADLGDGAHRSAIIDLVDAYSQDPMGDGAPLSADVRERLVSGLRDHPTTLVLLAYDGARSVGIAVCFFGYSTFAARPLINIHDLYVVADARGQGISRALLDAVSDRASSEGCCKVTLEVLENNVRARRVYETAGFVQATYVPEAGGALFMARPISAAQQGVRSSSRTPGGTMSSWNPDDYLRFGDERTRPSIDLASRIAVENPSMVIDLGCGPGNSTRVLTQRWPDARVTGLDSSAQMIGTARTEYPDGDWTLSPIEDWHPAASFDVVFSNAALQWLPDHGPLVERLFGHVSPGGALGFQLPSADYALVRTLIHEIAVDGAWAPRMAAPLGALTMQSPDFYYDHLASAARTLDIWETEYIHVMDAPSAIVDWIASTGLRPFLAVLESERESEEFVARLQQRVRESYSTRADGRVLFPFKRTFVIAYR